VISIAKFGFFIAAAVTQALPAFAQSAETYPNQPVRIVVPFSAGSNTDILARSFGSQLEGMWKQPVIIENRPGVAGAASVAKATPDGYTILLTSNGHSIIGSLNQSLNFDPIKDFSGVTQVASMPAVALAPPNGPKSIQELVALAKAKPGQLNYASAGLGSAGNIASELFKQVAGIDLVHVPHRGTPEGNLSILRGDTSVFFTFYNASGDLVDSGKVLALAVTSTKRLAVLPNVPTMQEAGYPTFDFDGWFGVLAPAGTPKPIIAKLNKDFATVLTDPGQKKRFSALGVELVGSTPEAFDKLIVYDAERFGKIFKPAAK
jgi:tripartite-type tricarboxylate transporter receptor subunit TctC